MVLTRRQKKETLMWIKKDNDGFHLVFLFSRFFVSLVLFGCFFSRFVSLGDFFCFTLILIFDDTWIFRFCFVFVTRLVDTRVNTNSRECFFVKVSLGLLIFFLNQSSTGSCFFLG